MSTVCPSGLAGTQRQMTMREILDLVESSKRGGGDEAITQVLDRTWTSTTDPGPYPFLQSGGGIESKRLPLVEVMFMLVGARIITHGRYHEIPYNCPGCRRANVAEVDLVEDLPVREMKPETAAIVRAGGLFRATLLDGSALTYRLATPEIEQSIDKVRQQLERDVKAKRRDPIPPRDRMDMFAAQAVFIEALGEDRSRDQKARLEFFWSWAAHEEPNLVEQMQEHDFGYDDVFHHVCANESCLRRNTLGLPLDMEFFRPSKLTRRERQERTATRSTLATSNEATSQAEAPTTAAD